MSRYWLLERSLSRPKVVQQVKIATFMLALSKPRLRSLFLMHTDEQSRHCVGTGEPESEAAIDCGVRTREYNVGLRVGTIFVIMVTGGIGVFAPMLLHRLPFRALNRTGISIVKQFGTGVILATALIHVSSNHSSVN